MAGRRTVIAQSQPSMIARCNLRATGHGELVRRALRDLPHQPHVPQPGRHPRPPVL